MFLCLNRLSVNAWSALEPILLDGHLHEETATPPNFKRYQQNTTCSAEPILWVTMNYYEGFPKCGYLQTIQVSMTSLHIETQGFGYIRVSYFQTKRYKTHRDFLRCFISLCQARFTQTARIQIFLPQPSRTSLFWFQDHVCWFIPGTSGVRRITSVLLGITTQWLPGWTQVQIHINTLFLHVFASVSPPVIKGNGKSPFMDGWFYHWNLMKASFVRMNHYHIWVPEGNPNVNFRYSAGSGIHVHTFPMTNGFGMFWVLRPFYLGRWVGDSISAMATNVYETRLSQGSPCVAEGHQARVLSATGLFGDRCLPHREAKEEGPHGFLGDVPAGDALNYTYVYIYIYTLYSILYHIISNYIMLYNYTLFMLYCIIYHQSVYVYIYIHIYIYIYINLYESRTKLYVKLNAMHKLIIHIHTTFMWTPLGENAGTVLDSTSLQNKKKHRLTHFNGTNNMSSLWAFQWLSIDQLPKMFSCCSISTHRKGRTIWRAEYCSDGKKKTLMNKSEETKQLGILPISMPESFLVCWGSAQVLQMTQLISAAGMNRQNRNKT